MNFIYKRKRIITLVFIVLLSCLFILSISCKGKTVETAEKESNSIVDFYKETEEATTASDNVLTSESQSLSEESCQSDSQSVNKYTVTFDSNGANDVPSQTVNEGDLVISPSNPSLEGYTFVGWYLGDNPFDFSTPITGDIVLKAKWVEILVGKTLSVTFLADDNSLISVQTVALNDTLQEPQIEQKDGYTFLGWYLGETKYDFSLPVTSNFVLIAKWQKNNMPTTYTVTFFTDTNEVFFAQSVVEGECVKKPEDPQKEGYTFLGWYLYDEQYDFDCTISSSIELIAKWLQDEVYYTVSFYSCGEIIDCQTVSKNETALIPTEPIKDGYVFIEWQNNGETYDFNAPVIEDITLTAKWEAKKDISSFIGLWSGEEISSVTASYTVDIFSNSQGVIYLSLNGSHEMEYEIIDVCFYANNVNIVYINNGREYKLVFNVVEDNLICEKGIFGEEIILSKKDN